MNSNLIAACGMNCNLCISYLRDKNKCPGCRLMDLKNAGQSNKRYSKKCTIKNCNIIKKNNWKFCSPECKRFPCQRLKNLDNRYKTKYGMSMLENLDFIHKNGIGIFIEHEKERWIKNDKIFCVHRKEYFDIKNKEE